MNKKQFTTELAHRAKEQMKEAGSDQAKAIEAALDQACAELSMHSYQKMIDSLGGLNKVRQLIETAIMTDFQTLPGGTHFMIDTWPELGPYIKLAEGFTQNGQSACYIHYPGESVTRHPFNAIDYEGTPSVVEPDKKCTPIVPIVRI